MTALKTYSFPNSVLFGSHAWPFQDTGAAQTPAYNISQSSEDAFSVTIAVPGVAESDIEVTEHDGRLNIRFGSETQLDAETEAADVTYLRREIATNHADVSFKLGAHVHVTQAKLDKGLLSIDLQRDIPEALQPKRIEVSQTSGSQSEAPRAA